MLDLHIQPGAKKSEVVGLHGDALKVRIASPPVDGRANGALLAFLAEVLDVSRQSLQVVKGTSSRHKMVWVSGSGVDPGRLLRLKP